MDGRRHRAPRTPKRNPEVPTNVFGDFPYVKKLKIEIDSREMPTSIKVEPTDENSFTSVHAKPSKDVPHVQRLKIEAVLSDSKENHEEEESTDAKVETSPHSLTFEERRLKNIRDNAEFLSQLNLGELKSEITGKKAQKYIVTDRGLEKEKVKRLYRKPSLPQPRRKSLRIQGLAANETAQSSTLTENTNNGYQEPEEHERRRDPEMLLSDSWINSREGEDIDLTSQTAAPPLSRKEQLDMDRFSEELAALQIRESDVAKVVKRRVTSIAVHPREDGDPFLVAGDKQGFVGIWDVGSTGGEDGVFTFDLHGAAVYGLAFDPANSNRFFSSSYDGTIRLTDLTSKKSTQVFSLSGDDCGTRIYSFDFTSANTMVASLGDGSIKQFDFRVKSPDIKTYPVAPGVIKSIHVHPLQSDVVACSAPNGVNVLDLRHVTIPKKKGAWCSALSSLPISRMVQSVNFTSQGNKMVALSMDNTIKIYDSSSLTQMKLHQVIRHDNHTGRWLTCFRCVSHPRFEDAFVVGCLGYPRNIQVFHSSGKLMRSLTGEYLSTICSINAVHPTKNIIVGGNSSGRLHVFR